MARTTEEDYAAWVNWVADHDWNVCGTLNFLTVRNVYGDEAERQFRHFFSRLDRLSYGQTGYHVERMVFTQHGAIGDNTHIHFVMRAPFDAKQFCMLFNALWADFHSAAAPPIENEILPIISKRAVSHYVLHDFWKMDSQTFNDRLSRLNPVGIIPHIKAAERMAAKTKQIWRMQATLAFDAHMAAAHARYEQRHR